MRHYSNPGPGRQALCLSIQRYQVQAKHIQKHRDNKLVMPSHTDTTTTTTTTTTTATKARTASHKHQSHSRHITFKYIQALQQTSRSERSRSRWSSTYLVTSYPVPALDLCAGKYPSVMSVIARPLPVSTAPAPAGLSRQ
ncbi:uncharacterized protein K452DRAFT_62791 [Aplosporella prunicola CBS 121167]|uniref:Uncharacterized protein n=1 Tax=Aplosporella prunicola CBS 121167 TaxID=1176127 RepID=A0A6A6B6U4_9PEZI|nr:uncharacterized protein K452DRAFT_62791 [Aplosporella prunicola CBS 121167]KAF2139606.1 hypothetical protein K452DRAFT_62791 [Aplosporella prunicola CBS 121167]